MEITRLTGLSLYYKTQEMLSQTRIKEKPKSANFQVYNLKYINVQPKYPITVYVNGAEKDKTLYTVDYTNGMLTFNNALTSSDVVEVSYTYCPINIYDESTSPQNDDFKYPAISIYESHRTDEAIELGSNKKELHPTWILEIWTERGGERDDITDKVVEMLEEGVIPIIDYNMAFPIIDGGILNDIFNETSQTIGFMDCDSIKYHKGGSLDIGEKPKYLSEIIVELTINT